MPGTGALRPRCSPEEERQELENVLASQTFRKAPNQTRMLRYLCEKYFSGSTEPVKEYQLAVEVLGRRDDYDQSEKSTVRVEAYRLRRKLKQYYQQEGADHPIRVVVEPGQYAARFMYVGDPADPGAETRSRRLRLITASAALILILAAVLATVLWRRRATQAPAVAQPTEAVEPAAAPRLNDEIRILAGYPRAFYIDSLGRSWSGDRYYSGGQPVTAPRRLMSRGADPGLFRYCRRGNFSYDIPAAPGSYELRLHFAPTFGSWSVAGPTVGLNIRFSINQKFRVIRASGPVDAGGAWMADERVFRNVSPATDGKVHLQFFSRTDYAFVNAIELLRNSSPRLRPLRMSVQSSYYTDQAGRLWQPERFVSGGSTILRTEPVEGKDPDLYSAERFGNFSYLIPAAEGRYGLTLLFAETWHGPGMPGGGGVGSRLFHVRCNGNTLLRDFDVFREAGGARRVVRRTFHGLTPNEEGKLLIEFEGHRGNAIVNALELQDETD